MTCRHTHLFILAALASLLLAPHIVRASEPSTDPLSLIQMNPVMMRYLDIEGQSALPSKNIHHIGIRQRFASIFLSDTLPAPTRFMADMEIHVTELQLKMQLGKTEIHTILPLVRPVGGILDSFLNKFHKALDLPNDGREFRPNNQYTYLLNGGWNSAAAWKAGNVTLGMQYPLLQGDDRGLAIAGSLKLPTASKSDGWGSGTWDAGLGLIASRQWDSAFVHLGAHYIHPFSTDYLATLNNRNYFRGALTLGWRGKWAVPLIERPLSAIIQFQGGTSPYKHTGIDALDEAPVLVAFGIRWRTESDNEWQFIFTENVTQRSTQDFSLSLGCDFF